MKKRLSKLEIETMFLRLAADRPDPRTELTFTNPFTLLVAVALSAQATDKSVNKATAPLFAIADTPEKMIALGEDGLARYIQSIGLWRTKARNVIALSHALLDKHGGNVPHDRAALEALPGVGRKTANVVLAEAFGEATIAVDTHVFRVANRTGLARGQTPGAVEAGLMKAVPAAYLRPAHHLLILHGRYVCLARAPRCGACVIAEFCLYPDKTNLGQDKGLDPLAGRRLTSATQASSPGAASPARRGAVSTRAKRKPPPAEA